jgi:SAM-dependent methyltransferase
MTGTEYIPALRFRVLTGLYDPLVRLTTRERRFKRQLLERAGVRPGERVLDLGCGTGTLALAAKRAQPEAIVIGLDADPAILDRARRKSEEAGAEITFADGVSTELPFADASFDIVLSTLFSTTSSPMRRGRLPMNWRASSRHPDDCTLPIGDHPRTH